MRTCISVLATALFFAGCGVDGNDADDGEDQAVDVVEQGLSNYTFNVPRNPTSVKSRALRATLTPAAGGVVNWFTIGDDQPFFEALFDNLNSRVAVTRTANMPCANYGAAYVNVFYTGARPRLQYTWTDCR